MRRRILGLLAAPIMVAQCAPPQCAPAPPPPVDTTTTVETTTTAVETTTTTTPVETTTTVAPLPGGYTFLASNGAGLYTRWSGCEAPIRWQLDVTVPPSQAFRDALAAALTSVTQYSGQTFEYVMDAGPALQPTIEAVIGLDPALAPGTLGRGGGRFSMSTYKMVSGSAYINPRLDDPLEATRLRTTLLHEIAHMVGLGHAPENTQVMFQSIASSPPQDYQGGDRDGLSLVGASQPCFAAARLSDADDEPTIEIILD